MKDLNLKKTIIIVFLLLIGFFCILFIFSNINRKSNVDVNLVFNTDRNYREYTKVAIKSAIENKNYSSIYHIDVICVDIPQKECEEFKSFEKENVYIRIFPESLSSLSSIGNYVINNYVTRTDLFKFKFDKIFSDRDKILYIDSDTLIRKDLRELFNTDISKYYLAAVIRLEPEISAGVDKNGKVHHYNKNYYNCGVLLLNLAKMRKDKISEKLIQAKNADEEKFYQTQKAFNVVIPPNTIKKLSPIYNDNGRWNDEYIKDFHYYRLYFPYSLRYYNIKILDEQSVIIHYSGFKKPWRDPAAKFGDDWRKYSKMINDDVDVKEIIGK
ncbi:hypothetical protein J6I39_05600 [bacterium]|nr:hypothetical protein [bacterium]